MAARRPRFNGDPVTLFEDGTMPAGYQTTEPGAATAPGASTAIKGLTVKEAGVGLEDGFQPGVALIGTGQSGTGAGGTADITIDAGQVQQATVAAGGANYTQGDELTVTGLADVVVVVTVLGD